ncbi:MAG: hypothetical protein AB1696_20400 [Planctomycetota bacterium]
MMRTRISSLGVWFLFIVLVAGCRSLSTAKTPPPPTDPKGPKAQASGVAVDIKEQIDKTPSQTSVAGTEVISALRKEGIEVQAEGKPEYVVMGEAEATFTGDSEIFGMKTSVYSAVVSLRVIDKHTGKILAATSADTRKMATEKQIAASGALREAADRAVKKIIEAIPRPKKK